MTFSRLARLPSKLAAAGVASRLFGVLGALLIVIAFAGGARAHEIQPAISTVLVEGDRLQVHVIVSLEPMIAGIDLRAVEDTDAAPQADRYDQLRAMDPDTLEAEFRDHWDRIREGLVLRAGDTALVPEILQLEIPPAGDLSLTRESTLLIGAPLPDDGTPVTIGWAPEFGALVVRQSEAGDDGYAALLDGGDVSAPLPRTGTVSETAGEVLGRFIVQGFEHIIPKGLDHIVFVLGLFFFSLQLRPLLFQITSFTLAHTVTLALAALDIVRIPASIVEPLIAASIVFVAVENILRPRLGAGRIAVVFLFGLLHGLGFASVLGELGGGQSHFIARLIGFNIGVEIGQLAVICAAFVLVGIWFGAKPWYRARIAVPASIVIAGVGLYWFIERVI